MSQIAALLAESSALHTEALIARRQHRPDAALLLEQARDKRLAAHEADPEHADPVWATERVPHATLMAFYAKHAPVVVLPQP